ncbi:MAG: hypothetical protein WBW31_15775 [Candidatus Sulfotelmatobacter sp.]
MSRSTKLAAGHFIFARTRELKLCFADRAGQDLNFIGSAIEGERVDHVGAGDAEMNRNPSRNQNAMGDEQVLLSDHANGDRAIGILLGSEIILDELPGQVKRQSIDVARASQPTQ